MSCPIGTHAASKRVLLTCLVAGAFLAVSLYALFTPTLAMEEWGQFFFACFGMLSLLILAFVWLSEVLGASRQYASAGFQMRIDELQKRLNAQDDFFRSISDGTPSTLTIYDANNTYWFINASAATELNQTGAHVVGRRPVEILGGERGHEVERNLEQVKITGKSHEILHQDIDVRGHVRYIQTSYLPLSPAGEFPGGVMARDENVTSIVVERERRENMFQQIISTLVAVVDRRDPYASGHSARVGHLSRALAVELALSSVEIESAEIAGSLMNFGKVLISRAILTKTENLTPAELQRVRDGILTSADILSMIDFSTPVVPTLRQVLERFDGTGVPQGLKGDAILITARIVSVANAFVAIVSPRAYRSGVSLIDAHHRLAEGSGTVFDPTVIAGIERLITKKNAKLDWLSGSKSL